MKRILWVTSLERNQVSRIQNTEQKLMIIQILNPAIIGTYNVNAITAAGTFNRNILR